MADRLGVDDVYKRRIVQEAADRVAERELAEPEAPTELFAEPAKPAPPAPKPTPPPAPKAEAPPPTPEPVRSPYYKTAPKQLLHNTNIRRFIFLRTSVYFTIRL